jgi:hypothetical protein
MNPPKKLYLGGTPLNHAIVTAMDLLPKYKKETGVQKINTIFLTDGESHRIKSKFTIVNDINTTESFDADPQMVITDPITNTTVIEDQFKPKTRRMLTSRGVQTTMLLTLLKKRIPDMNILGFFVAGSGKQGYVKKEVIMQEMECSWAESYEYAKIISKDKVLVSTKKGYDEWYILPGGAKLDIESGNLDVEVGASKASLKRAFGKASKGKVTSRVLLNKFIQKVA